MFRTSDGSIHILLYTRKKQGPLQLTLLSAVIIERFGHNSPLALPLACSGLVCRVLSWDFCDDFGFGQGVDDLRFTAAFLPGRAVQGSIEGHVNYMCLIAY